MNEAAAANYLAAMDMRRVMLYSIWERQVLSAPSGKARKAGLSWEN